MIPKNQCILHIPKSPFSSKKVSNQFRNIAPLFYALRMKMHQRFQNPKWVLFQCYPKQKIPETFGFKNFKTLNGYYSNATLISEQIGSYAYYNFKTLNGYYSNATYNRVKY